MLLLIKKYLWYRKNMNKVIYFDNTKSTWFKMCNLKYMNSNIYIGYITGRYGYIDSDCIDPMGENKNKYFKLQDIDLTKEPT